MGENILEVPNCANCSGSVDEEIAALRAIEAVTPEGIVHFRFCRVCLAEYMAIPTTEGAQTYRNKMWDRLALVYGATKGNA